MFELMPCHYQTSADLRGFQIRIVTDTHDEGDEAKSRKKKKAHRGYAFIVYEREKDMKGTTSISTIADSTRQACSCILD